MARKKPTQGTPKASTRLVNVDQGVPDQAGVAEHPPIFLNRPAEIAAEQEGTEQVVFGPVLEEQAGSPPAEPIQEPAAPPEPERQRSPAERLKELEEEYGTDVLYDYGSEIQDAEEWLEENKDLPEAEQHDMLDEWEFRLHEWRAEQQAEVVAPPELERLEAIVAKEEAHHWEAIKALREIREKDLYKAELHGKQYESFDDYMAERWGRTRQWATYEIATLGFFELMAAKTGKSFYQVPLSKDAAHKFSKLLALEDGGTQVFEAYYEALAMSRAAHELEVKADPTTSKWDGQITGSEAQEVVKRRLAYVKERERMGASLGLTYQEYLTLSRFGKNRPAYTGLLERMFQELVKTRPPEQAIIEASREFKCLPSDDTLMRHFRGEALAKAVLALWPQKVAEGEAEELKQFKANQVKDRKKQKDDILKIFQPEEEEQEKGLPEMEEPVAQGPESVGIPDGDLGQAIIRHATGLALVLDRLRASPLQGQILDQNGKLMVNELTKVLKDIEWLIEEIPNEQHDVG